LCQSDKIFYRQPLGPEVEDLIRRVETLRQHRLEGVAQGFPALVERSFYHLPEQALVAAEFRAGVASEPYHG